MEIDSQQEIGSRAEKTRTRATDFCCSQSQLRCELMTDGQKFQAAGRELDDSNKREAKQLVVGNERRRLLLLCACSCTTTRLVLAEVVDGPRGPLNNSPIGKEYPFSFSYKGLRNPADHIYTLPKKMADHIYTLRATPRELVKMDG